MLDWDEIAKMSAAIPSSDVDIEYVTRRGGALKRQRLLSMVTLVALVAASGIGVLKASSSNERTAPPADHPPVERTDGRAEIREKMARVQARLEEQIDQLDDAARRLDEARPRSEKAATLREKIDAIHDEIAEQQAEFTRLIGLVDVAPKGEVVVLQEGTFDETWGTDAGMRWELRIWEAEAGECHQFAVGDQPLDQGLACTVPGKGSQDDVASIGYESGVSGNGLGKLLGKVSARTDKVVAVDQDGERFDIEVLRAVEPWRSSFGYYVALLPSAAYFDIEAYSRSGELLQTRRLDLGSGGKGRSGVRCESSVGLEGCPSPS